VLSERLIAYALDDEQALPAMRSWLRDNNG
jgi:hypothetical protein